MKKTISILFLFLGVSSYAQKKPVIDEIAAVVGDHIILRSDLEAEYMQAKKDMSFYSGDLKCEILNQLIIHGGFINLILNTLDLVKFKFITPFVFSS